MADLTPDRLQELRRIAEAATPGPWRVNKYGPTRRIMSIGAGKYGTDPVIANVETFWSKREQEKYGDHGANAVHIATFDPPTVLALLDEIERLRREREAALDILSRKDIGDGAKVEGVRLILKGGDRGRPTRESERARLVAEVGECCRGADPLCATGCLVEAALRQRLVNVEEMLGLAFEGEEDDD